jgi:hypothetical protein
MTRIIKPRFQANAMAKRIADPYLETEHSGTSLKYIFIGDGVQF